MIILPSEKLSQQVHGVGGVGRLPGHDEGPGPGFELLVAQASERFADVQTGVQGIDGEVGKNFLGHIQEIEQHVGRFTR